jgi:signal peptidase I
MTSPEGDIVGQAPPPEAEVETPAPSAVEEQLQAQPGDSTQIVTSPPVSPKYKNGETLIQSLLSIIVIVLFVITFIVQAFQIPSESMERTLLVGDYLLVDKIHFGQGGAFNWLLPYSDLKRGDIVVFHYPVDPSQHFVKRVVGLPGDHILMRHKTVFVNDEALQESYAIHLFGNRDSYRDNFPSEPDFSGQVNVRWRSELRKHLQDGELVVPPDEYFVMGDNRDNSQDSRYWGFVPRANIVGRPLIIYLSVREQSRDDVAADNGKLIPSGHLLSHIWEFARWNRMFHLVR